jgi:hypothetical protein
VRQTRAMMSRDTVKKDRLQGRISQQVGGPGHLCKRRGRATHRHDDPAHSCVGDDQRLTCELRIVTVDCRQRHDRLDPLAGDDRPQRFRILPSATNQEAGDDDANSFLSLSKPDGRGCPTRRNRDRQHNDHARPESDPSHQRSGTRQDPCDEEAPAEPLWLGNFSLSTGCGNPNILIICHLCGVTSRRASSHNPRIAGCRAAAGHDRNRSISD